MSEQEAAAWRALFQTDGAPVPTPASVKQSLEAERKRASASVLRLAFLEGECGRLQQALQQLHGASQPPRPSLVDPSINALFVKLKEDLKASETRSKQLEEENHALQFAPNSALGRRLLSRCKQLLAENEALGAQIGEGKVATLEAALAVERQLTAEVRQALAEAQNGVLVLDGELEQMQRALLNRTARKRRRDDGDVKSDVPEEDKRDEKSSVDQVKKAGRTGEEALDASDEVVLDKETATLDQS